MCFPCDLYGPYFGWPYHHKSSNWMLQMWWENAELWDIESLRMSEFAPFPTKFLDIMAKYKLWDKLPWENWFKTRLSLLPCVNGMACSQRSFMNVLCKTKRINYIEASTFEKCFNNHLKVREVNLFPINGWYFPNIFNKAWGCLKSYIWSVIWDFLGIFTNKFYKKQ